VLHEVLLRPRAELFTAIAACLPHRKIPPFHHPSLSLQQKPRYITSIVSTRRKGYAISQMRATEQKRAHTKPAYPDIVPAKPGED